MKWIAIIWAWFSAFLEKAFVSRVMRRFTIAGADIEGRYQLRVRIQPDSRPDIASASQAASETGAAAGGVLDSAKGLTRLSEALRDDVDRFVSNIRAA